MNAAPSRSAARTANPDRSPLPVQTSRPDSTIRNVPIVACSTSPLTDAIVHARLCAADNIGIRQTRHRCCSEESHVPISAMPRPASHHSGLMESEPETLAP